MVVYVVVALLLVLLAGLALSVRILKQYERAVIFRLGRVRGGARGPGLIVLIPFVDRVHRVSLRIVTMPIQSQGIITRDNVSIDVSAVAYYRVKDTVRSVVAIENVSAAINLEIRRPTARAVVQSPRLAPLRRAAEFIGDPVPSWLLFNLVFLAWHLPAAYDATLQSQPVHVLEHATFFATGLLFWTRVIDSPPWRSALSDVGRAIYVGLALVIGWMLAVVLALATSPLYAPYAAQASRPGGISALADQHLAAGMMWVPGSIPFTVVILFLAYRWLEPEAAIKEGGAAGVHTTERRHLTAG